MSNNRFKNSDSTSDKINQLLEDCNNRLSFNGINFAERYMEERLDIVMHLRNSKHSEEYHAFISLIPNGSGKLTRRALNENGIKQHSLTTIADSYESLVFINGLKLSQYPEQFTLPVLVRLQRADMSLGDRREFLYFFLGSGEFKFIPAIGSREISVCNTSTISDSKVTDKYIEAGAQIADNISNNSLDIPIEPFSQLDFNKYFSASRIDIFKDSIRFSFKESNNSSIEFLDVGFGAFNL